MDNSISDRVTMVGGGAQEAGELAAGQRVGQYEILRLLGRGGMGQVYLARHGLQKTLHALKILPTEFSGLPGFVERFNTELRTMAAMQHPSIVHVQYSDVAEGRYYLVMDFVGADGTETPYDLSAALKAQSRLAPETVRRLALQLCEGLEYAHARGIIHRDLKPANVLLTSKLLSRADVKICDFGLARVLGEEQVQAHEAEKARRSMSIGDRGTVAAKQPSGNVGGGVLGTYGYMSPEQELGKPADARSDVYAMGVILYTLLTGQRPMGLAKPPSQVVRGLSPEWDKVIATCMEIEPAARWQSIKQLKRALDRLHGAKAGGGAKAALRAAVWLVAAAAVAVGLSYAYVKVGEKTKPPERDVSAVPGFTPKQENDISNAIYLINVTPKPNPPPKPAPVKVETKEERLARIRADAAEALRGGELGLAKEKIDQLAKEEGLGAVAELRKQYEAKVAENDAVQRRQTAWIAERKAMAMGRGQGFGEKLDGLAALWKEAEAAQNSGAWTQACARYDAVMAECRRLTELNALRLLALQGKQEAVNAKAAAEAGGPMQDAKAFFDKGGAAFAEAEKDFEKGEFGSAGKMWRDAAAAYAGAQAAVEALQGLRKAKEAYEAALAPVAELLAKHGGPAWAEVQKKVLAGELTENAPAVRRTSYEEARVVLAGAVTEAKAAQRAAKTEGLLAGARQAKAAEQWKSCVEQCDAVLALDAENAEALALKKEAADSLITALAVTVEADGKAVEATFSDGKETYVSPQTVELRRGEDYVFTVSYRPKASAVRYKDVKWQGKADWKGVRLWEVKLEEHRGPIDGEAWTSPSTRMEFVWVPKLGVWVGKYEVMNQEYRMKVPAHDSKMFKGKALNGDRQPAVLVNYGDAVAYAAWLTERDKESLGECRYRLPSDAEWLACAQCGEKRIYPWGNTLPPTSGNYADATLRSLGLYAIDGCKDGETVTCDVERSGMNEWGLFGVGGNVWECCSLDEKGVLFGSWRGASWMFTYPDRLKCAYRNSNEETLRDNDRGFRLVVSH